MIKEACVETFEEAQKAEQQGASRIELCSDLANDGLTPSPELMQKTCAALKIPVMVMIRPRAGKGESESLTSSETLAKGLPESFTVKGVFAADNAKLNMLGSRGNLKWENTNEGVKIFIPRKIRNNLPCDLAWAVKISEVK